MTALSSIILSFLIGTSPVDKDTSNIKNISVYNDNEIFLDPIDIKAAEVEKDSTKAKEYTEVDYGYSGAIEFGNNSGFGFRGNLLTKIRTPYGLEVNALPYLFVKSNQCGENAKTGLLVNAKYNKISSGFNIGYERKSLHTADSSFISRVETGLVQNGVFARSIDEQEFSNQDIERKGSNKGLEFELDKFKFQIGSDGKTEIVEGNTRNIYNEVYRDSTRDNQGQVITKTNLSIDIVTNARTRVKITDNKNSARLGYLIGNSELGMGIGFILENNEIENEIRNRTNIITDINGHTIVEIGGAYSDTILVSSHEEEYRNSVIRDGTSINTDYIHLSPRVGRKDKKLNYKIDFDKCFFKSNGEHPWHIEQTLDYRIANLQNALRFGVGDRSIGGGLILVANRLPDPLINNGMVNDYLLKRADIDRNVAINDIYKNILHKYNDIDFTKRFVGPFAEFNIEKVYGDPSQLDIKSKLGYSNMGWAGWFEHNYNSFKKNHKFSGSFVYDDFSVGTYFETNDDSHGFGLEINYIPGPDKK